ncbi:MAG: hypothetical protein H7A23_13170 [Leptospiraceae bacterium]|nr:hypothetical protein [Leptospiraceae bacterium]MCP5495500.1 hypothetical protein [Leptospiraceae bacterium]
MNRIFEAILNTIKKKKVIFFIILILFYKLLFNSFSGEFIVNKSLNSFSNGKFKSSVKQFSLFYGFILEDIEFLSGSDFNNKPFLTTKRLAITYNIPLLFIGKIKVSEISLTKPKVYLYQKAGKWNVETLFPSSGEKEKEKEKEKSEPMDEISLPLPISTYLNMFIEDLCVYVYGEEGEKYFYSKLEGLNFQAFLETNRFRNIPFSSKLLSVIDKFYIKLNPESELKIELADTSNSLNTDFRLTYILIRDATVSPSRFYSKLDVGNELIPVKVKNKVAAPFGVQILYDLIYTPETDILSLNQFTVSLSDVKWLNFKGNIFKATQNDRNIDMQIHESEILLEPLSKILATVPILPPVSMGGKIQLAPITFLGNLNDVLVKGNLKGDKIRVTWAGKTHSIPIFRFDFESKLNLLTEEKPSEANLIPMLKYIKINEFMVQYGNIVAKLNGIISPKDKIDVKIILNKLNIQQFVSDLTGILSVKVDATGTTLSYLDIDLEATIDGFRYKIGRATSGINNLKILLETKLDLSKNFSVESFELEPLEIVVKNENNEIAAKLQTLFDLDILDHMLIKVRKLELSTNLTKIIPTLPSSYRRTISGLRSALGNELALYGSVDFNNKGGKKDLDIDLDISLPALELKGSNLLKLNAYTLMENDAKKTFKIEKFIISAYEKKLYGEFKGEFYESKAAVAPFGSYTGKANGYLSLESNVPRYILEGVTFQGDLDLNIDIKDFIITGKLFTKDSDIVYTSPNCTKEKCSKYEIIDLVMDIPFLHDLGLKDSKNLLKGNKQSYVESYGNESPSNFKIGKVIGNHPSVKGAKLEFVKPSGRFPGISARIDYTENFLSIDEMRIFCLDGVIYGKDLMFNVGDGDLDEMQYSGFLQIRDIDLKQLMPQEMAKKIDDGKIKADVNVSGQNLKDPLDYTDLYFSIFQIGKDFGKSAINIVSPQNRLTDLIIQSYNVDRVEVKLLNGLVYAYIKFHKTILNTLVFGIEDDKISQERIPISGFLDRAESEISTYQK